MGKRFIFAMLAIYCASWVAITNNYPAVEYSKIVLYICGIFTLGQSVTDYKHK